MANTQFPRFFFGDKLLEIIKHLDKAERVDFIKNRNLHKSRQNQGKETLLHIVARSGDAEIVKALIAAGSDVNAKDKAGKTPIMSAIENKSHEYLEVINILSESSANIYIKNKRGQTAKQLLVNDPQFGYHFVQKIILNAIYCLCMKDSMMTAKKLISLNYSIRDVVILGNPDVIENMILEGCSVHSRCIEEQTTALCKAVELMNLDIIKVLIKYGADVDSEDASQFLPINRYGRYTPPERQEPEIVRILLQKSVLLKNLNDESAVDQLRSVFQYGNKGVIQILLDHHSDIFNTIGLQYQTPLHYLSKNYNADVTEPLQGKTLNVNAKDGVDRTPLHLASESPCTHMNTFKFLLKNNANVNAAARAALDFDVPLFSLCQNSSMSKKHYYEILDLFLEYNLDIQYTGLNQKTVFDIILRNQKFYMAYPLIARLAILDELEKPISGCIRQKIMSHELFEKCFAACKGELASMKNRKITNNLTLYMMVVGDKNEIQAYKSCRYSPSALLKLVELKKMFASDSYYYSTIVQKRISPILSRLELLQEAAPVLCKILSFREDPYHIAIVEILDYLNEQDLLNLAKVDM